MGNVFTIPIESFISILLNAKCVNNRSTKLDGNNVPKFGSMVTKYFPVVAKMKGNIYTTNISLSGDKACMWPITGLFAVSQLYPCVLQLIILRSCQIQHLSKSEGWLNSLRQLKTSIFSSLCHCRETQLLWYQNYFAINVRPGINGKEWNYAHYPIIDICIYDIYIYYISSLREGC